MAETTLGNSGEVVLHGVDQQNLNHSMAVLMGDNIDFSPFIGRDGLVAAVRDAATHTSSEEEWIHTTDQLGAAVEGIRQQVHWADLGSVAVIKFGIAVPNPDFNVSPILDESSERFLGTRYSGATKYVTLSGVEQLRSLLSGSNDQPKQKRTRRRGHNIPNSAKLDPAEVLVAVGLHEYNPAVKLDHIDRTSRISVPGYDLKRGRSGTVNWEDDDFSVSATLRDAFDLFY